MKTIYDLELHEELILDDMYNTSIRKVPGGWIYTKEFNGVNQVFVPFKERELTEEEMHQECENWASVIQSNNTK